MGKDPSALGEDQRKDNRRTFYVSEGYSDVHTILDNLPRNEASRFVCEAIRHYSSYKNNPNWLGEQLQSVIGMATQLQQMMGAMGMVVPPAPNTQQFMPMNPQTGTPVYTNPVAYETPSTQPAVQQTQPVAQQNDSTASTTEAETTPIKHDGAFPTAQHVVQTALKEIASASPAEQPKDQEQSQVDDQSSTGNTANENPPERRRRKSGMASSLANKSMGKKDD